MNNWKKIFFLFTAFLLAQFLGGCSGITEVDKSNSARATANILSGANQALIYPDNPSILAGKTVGIADYNGLLRSAFITDKLTLEGDCFFTQSVSNIFSPGSTTEITGEKSNCLSVLNDNNSETTLLQPAIDGSWDYPMHSDEFYQVNTFFHTKLIVDRFFEALKFTHHHVHFESNLSIPPATKHNLLSTGSFWLNEAGTQVELKSFSECNVDINAFFSPALNTLCYGIEGGSSRFRMVQDPTVIYHEVGHALVKVMMNQRNLTSEINSGAVLTSHPFESNLGNIGYDEAGAINEGVADYFSYVMTAREELGEFALSKFFGSPRPLSEDSASHTVEVSTALGERLSYPNFLHYDPHGPEGEKIEDIHNVGETVSHYLVALTNAFKNSCEFSKTDTETIHKESTNYILMLLNETFAEIGDLTAAASDFLSKDATGLNSLSDVYFTNLNPEASFLWTQFVNPPNFRRFFQIFGKNIFHYISNDLCPQFSIDDSEFLLDEYGLLLFKSYEDRGNGLNSSNFLAQTYQLFSSGTISTSAASNRSITPAIFNSAVNENNRKRSILIAKEFIELNDSPTAFVIDNQSDIKEFLSELTFEGSNVITSEGLAGPEYNNNNISISPGEIVALSLNLKNTSNSIMGGVQVLANDWDHMKLNDLSDTFVNSTHNLNGLSNGDINSSTQGIATHSPCIMDDFPSESEGGVSDSSTTTQGNCSFISKNNKQIDNTSQIVNSIIYPQYDLDSPQPICLAQFSDESDTKWVSQDFFRKRQLGLEDNDCLNNPSMSTDKFNPNECLIRFLPGASQMMFGKIDPQKTWTETIKNDEGVITFDPSRVALMEVNKWINPGTKFTCRFRVRFSNCSDCYDNFPANGSPVNLSDYSDFEFAGGTPYKIINFQFTVID